LLSPHEQAGGPATALRSTPACSSIDWRNKHQHDLAENGISLLDLWTAHSPALARAHTLKVCRHL
jgi:hypothetical protein